MSNIYQFGGNPNIPDRTQIVGQLQTDLAEVRRLFDLATPLLQLAEPPISRGFLAVVKDEISKKDCSTLFDLLAMLSQKIADMGAYANSLSGIFGMDQIFSQAWHISNIATNTWSNIDIGTRALRELIWAFDRHNHSSELHEVYLKVPPLGKMLSDFILGVEHSFTIV